MGGMVSLWGASSLIKSIQRGSVVSAAGTVTGTATITAVNLANAVLVWLGAKSTDTNADQRYGMCDIALTNATTVTITRGGNNGDTTASFEVIEFAPGVVKSVQSGRVAISGNPTNVTVTAVDMAKSQLFFLGASAAGAFVWTGAQGEVSVALTTTTNVAFSLVNTGVSHTGSWFLVEFF